MRILVSAIFVAATLMMGLPVRAQTYDPRYPVCLQVYFPDNSIQCGYTSMPQCRAAASGRAAECLINPYFGGGRYVRGYRPRF